MEKLKQHSLLFAILSCLLATSTINCAEDANNRLNCILIDSTLSEAQCIAHGCLVDRNQTNGAPWCYLDTKVVGYTVSKPVTRADGIEGNLLLKQDAYRSTNFEQIYKLNLSVNYLTDNILRIKITDANKKRYEVPVQSDYNIPSANHSDKIAYQVTLTDAFNLLVIRKDSGSKILDTSIGGLIFGDRFIQFATYLAPGDIYGMGENVHSVFRHDLHYKTYPIFTRDKLLGDPDANEYGAHPFFTVVESDGKAYGIFLLNSNAMAYTFLPSPAVSLKTTGGILDLFIFVGDNPEHVIQLYTSMIGRPVMPPFWGLGFQLCRYNYRTLEQVKKVLKRNFDHNMPIDVSYLDIDYMDEFRDFTYDKEHYATLPEYIKETKALNNLRWALILDPAIQADRLSYDPFQDGYKKEVYVKWPKEMPVSERPKAENAPSDKDIMYGKVWPKGPAAFPDFFKNATIQWWKEQISAFHKVLQFDALWIDMNEPSNFESDFLKCPIDQHWDFTLPEQKFKETLSTQTICMNAIQGENGEYRHFDVHSLYGLSETKPTQEALHEATGKRGFIVTRSTYPSSGKYAAHWLGDNRSQWNHMKMSIVGMLEFSLFGISYTGADICGFVDNTTPELCRRWLQLGAYYPFSRSHNAMDLNHDQDPGYWVEAGHPEVTKAAVDAFRVRYQLLHYLYTRFYRSHVTGETLVRPLHHVFPHDPVARTIDEQFFLGSSIMVSPFLHENQTIVNAFVPNDTEWYQMSADFVHKAEPITGHIAIPDSESHRPLLVRAGSILPVVGESSLPKPLNSFTLRKAPIDLWILPNATGHAYGDLFYDDGESIDTVEKGEYNYYQFSLNNCKLNIDLTHSGYKASTGTQDIIQIKTILVALSSRISADSLDVSLNENETLKSEISNGALKLSHSIDLLQAKSISISFKDKQNDKCFVH